MPMVAAALNSETDLHIDYLLKACVSYQLYIRRVCRYVSQHPPPCCDFSG